MMGEVVLVLKSDDVRLEVFAEGVHCLGVLSTPRMLLLGDACGCVMKTAAGAPSVRVQRGKNSCEVDARTVWHVREGDVIDLGDGHVLTCQGVDQQSIDEDRRR